MMDDDERWRTGGVLACSWWCGFDFVGAARKLIVSCLLLAVVCAMVLRRGIHDPIVKTSNMRKRHTGLLCAFDTAWVALIL